MKRTYESARVLVRRATGPLASHLDPFIASLIEQQYRASVIYIKARHGLALDRWLAKRRVVLAEAQIERYQDRCRPIRPIRTMSRSHGILALGKRRYSRSGHSPARDIVDPMASSP
jgi:hypothetical protein